MGRDFDFVFYGKSMTDSVAIIQKQMYSIIVYFFTGESNESIA